MPDFINTDPGYVSDRDYDKIQALVLEYADDMSATELVEQLSNKLPRYFCPVRTGHYIVLGLIIGKVAALHDLENVNRDN